MRWPAYSEYKESGSSVLDRIPSHWLVKPLKRCVSKCTDVGASLENPIALENVESWTGRFRQIDPEAGTEGIRVRPGDVLFGKLRPYLAKVYLAKEFGAAVGDFHVFRPLSDTKSEFVFYQVLRDEFISAANSAAYGAKMPRVSWEYLSQIPFALPPLPEQRAIAAFLDYETARIDTLIEEQQRLIDLLQEKCQAVICRAVTKGLEGDVPVKDSGVQWLGEVPAHWTICAIKHLSPVLRGASPRPIDDPVYFDDNERYGWVRISDVTASNGFLQSTTQRLSQLGASLSVKLEPGNLFLSIAGTVGKPCITKIHCCIHDGFVHFPMLKVDPMFLFYIFDAGQAYKGLGKMGTQLNLNTDTVGAIKVARPPDKEIKEIVEHLNHILAQYDVLIDKAQSLTRLLTERRSALISATVTGKIDVRGWKLQNASVEHELPQAAETEAPYG